jgi:hypothetical protein
MYSLTFPYCMLISYRLSELCPLSIAYHSIAITLAVGFITLLSYFLWTSTGGSKTATPNTLSNSEPATQRTQTDDGISNADQQILDKYKWTEYYGLSHAIKAVIEDALLKGIISLQFPALTEEDVSKASSRLLQDPIFHVLLLHCWEKGSFELLRSHGTLFCEQDFRP